MSNCYPLILKANQLTNNCLLFYIIYCQPKWSISLGKKQNVAKNFSLVLIWFLLHIHLKKEFDHSILMFYQTFSCFLLFLFSNHLVIQLVAAPILSSTDHLLIWAKKNLPLITCVHLQSSNNVLSNSPKLQLSVTFSSHLLQNLNSSHLKAWMNLAINEKWSLNLI